MRLDPAIRLARFTRRQRTVHLLILVLFLVQLPTGKMLAEAFPHLSSPLVGAPLVHAIGGSLVLLFGVALLAQNLFVGAPPPLPMPRWQRWAARIVHSLLFLLLLGVPLSGLVTLGINPSAAAVHTAFVGLVLATVAVHAAGALFHRYVQRDSTLWRMFGHDRDDSLRAKLSKMTDGHRF